MAEVTLPISPFQITQVFGVNAQNYARFGLAGHNGWDIRTIYPDSPLGKREILMPQDATFYTKAFETGGYGVYFEVITRTSKSVWKHTFAHCQEIYSFTTKPQGQAGAISDNTGNSSAPHTHWTTKRIKINKNGTHEVIDYTNGYKGAVNPQDYIDEVRADNIQTMDPLEAERRKQAKIQIDRTLIFFKDEKFIDNDASELYLDNVDSNDPGKFLGLVKRIVRDLKLANPVVDVSAIKKAERDRVVAEGVKRLQGI